MLPANAPKEPDDLARYLAALERDSCYRAIRPLSHGEGGGASTELVEFEGARGGALGPFVRKRIPLNDGMGSAYEALFSAQREGSRFAHLPRIVDCYKTSDELVVISEYIEGATLEELVHEGGVAEDFAPVVFPAVCDALAELHGLCEPPLIHRDVKPSNIVISNVPDGVTATLIDFGIARRYREGSEADTVRFGTRAYAPPEQFGFGQTSVRSDVYALGMVLLYCLTGTEPAGQPTAESLEAQGVQPDIVAVVLKATAFDPATRYATALELKEAYLAALSASSPSASAAAEAPAVPTAPGSEAAEPSAASPAPARAAFAPVLATSAPARTASASVPVAPAPATNPSGTAPRSSKPHAPSWLTWAWNLMLVIAAFAFFAQGVAETMAPKGSLAGKPLWYVIGITWFIVLPLIWGGLFLMLNRRALGRVFPVFQKRSRGEDARIIGAYLLIAFAVLVIASLAVGI